MEPPVASPGAEGAAIGPDERRRITAAVFTRPQETRELSDGYALSFPATDAWASDLDAFVDMWRVSCPYLRFELVDDPDDRTRRLEIRGPEGTKGFVEGAQRMLTSYLNPAPSPRRAARWRFNSLTARLRVLPDFLIIGSMKCGTTSLYSYLMEHPGATPAFAKEIHFFNRRFHLGADWYRRFFPTSLAQTWRRLAAGAALTGEATPTYLVVPKVALRVRQVVPNAKLIAILRNPADRAYSLYQHYLRMGIERRSFETAIDEAEANPTPIPNGYLRGGHYADHLNRWFEQFPRERVHVLTSDDLQDAPAESIRRIWQFLGLRDREAPARRRLNALPYPPMAPETRQRLVEHFREPNAQLASLLGRELPWDR